MLKFNLTQDGKNLIDALHGDAKLAITKVSLRSSSFDNKTSKDITSFKGAVCNDGTGNGAYVVIDITDNSTSNYSCDVIELFSDQTKIATQCVDEQSGYEVTLYCGERGRNEHPSITYRTQTWESGKTPTYIQLSKSMASDGKQCGISLSGGGVERGYAAFDFDENGNFPETITFANGDVWVTNETVSATGVTTQADYYASSETGETSIRPLFSKVLIQKDSNKQLKLRVSCQFDGAEKCKFNTTSINLPYATRFREGVVRLADPSEVYGKDGQRYNTVYSAADVDAKISQLTDSLGNLNQYAKKAETNEFTAANTFTAGITVNGEIGGTAVTDAGGGDKHIVNVGYADSKYLSKNDAGTTYLSKIDADNKYLSKTEAGNTYLTQENAANKYLTKSDAEQAAVNYAKLNVGNTFTGEKNTFNEVSATKFSGNGVVKSITDSTQDNAELIPTDGAVKTYVDGKTSTLTQNIATLQGKDNDLQSQIDGINAGQNLADIVNNTGALASYDVSHLKAKDDFQHGTSGAKWAIGDKVQVLGGGDVQSSVYELFKGTKPAGKESKDIQSTNNLAYYWHYIGVYGTNAYTKAEVDNKLGNKVDKTQITTTISGDTVTNENIPSASAVKTYVDTVANGLPNKYVTLDTAQEITGAKTFANGNITIANPNDGHKDKHYVWVTASGDNTTGDYTSSVDHYDLTHNDTASDRFMRARSSDYVFYTSDLTRFNSENNAQFNTRLNQQIGTSYKYIASDILITTNIRGVPEAQIGTPGNTASTDGSLKENYVERIRLRKNTSVATSTEGGFLTAGQSVTDIDLFADNINNVFSNEVSFRVCTTADGGTKTDTPVLKINGSGIHYHTSDGSSIGEPEYQLRTAGSLDFTTDMLQSVGSDAHVPTTKAVADFVDNKISGITGGTLFVKTSAPGTNQTINSAITVTQGITVGANKTPANLDVTGVITGNAVATRALESENGTRLTTEGAVVSFVNGKLAENRFDISNKTKVGAMGLFLYTGGDLKEMGAEIDGTLLQAVGMQLPMDGVVSWSQGTQMQGKWKLLNNTIAGESCLVLAIRVA